MKPHIGVSSLSINGLNTSTNNENLHHYYRVHMATIVVYTVMYMYLLL